MPGALAARVMGWQRRMANLPGPARASGEASNGEPAQVEVLIGGEWVDITSYTMVRDNSGSIRLTKGIRSEGSQTDFSSSALELRNTDGRFNPELPTGPYYELIGQNTPVRISVPDGIGGKSYRIRPEVGDWAQDWERSGNDVWTTAELSGILRRLAQAPLPEHSVIYDAVADPLSTNVVAYWPCEDPSTATSIASPLTNGSPMTISGTADLASYDGFKASDPLPDLTTATLSGGVVRYPDATAHQIRFLAHIPLEGLSDGKVLCAIDQEQYGGATFWELYYTTTGNTLILRQHDSDGALLGIELTHTVDVRGRQMYISVELQESGTGVTRAVRVTDVNSRQVYSATDTAAVTQLTRVTRVQFGPASRSVVSPIGTQYLPGVAVGHVTVENVISATTALGVRVNPIGETAGRRIQRLCDQMGVPFQWVGDLDDTVAMGAQGRSNELTLIRECVEADGGMLYESLDVHGLGYRTRASLYNQDPALILDYEGYNLAEVPVPVRDDQLIANKVTVTANGVSATYEETEGRMSTALPPAGVGVYGPSDTALNLASTDEAVLRDHAAWRVHLGTVPGSRYPRVSVNLAHPSITPDMRRAVLGLRQGDRVQIVNPPAWLPPDTIDQLVLGFEESITHFEHRLTFICAPAAPYAVYDLDDEGARIDTDGSETVTAISSSDTTVYVAPSAGESCLWTTDTADMPFDVRAGGEVMSVTACTGFIEDAFARTSSNSWGSADTGQAWTSAGGVAADYSVGSGYGVHVLSTVDATRRTSIAAIHPDCDFYGSITTSALATGNSLFGALTARMLDSENMYMARLEFTTANTIVLMLRKLVANVGTDLGSVTVPATHVAGTFIRVRLQCQGTAIKTKAWVAGTVEPPRWDVEATDSSIVAANSLGTRSITVTGNTNGAAVQIRYDDFDVVNPQTLTVTRSVNGCVKAHSAGTDVRLAYPTYLAL
ncbi:hypothetical protein PV755_44445 [Streptomyces caniscabiei]|uniref:hypothetical protein n=1 Tax=Streptomyces caniscabiei TaxID=2746961 RepID=UPI0029B9C400|nr:hypothetical protein [Streptomyces caniscabiei]MDX3515872.1 hypothetical protein [Streptomyces caniscabiei]MDX3725052.1 hypothetical protein [Streptomyces caniscabiei]